MNKDKISKSTAVLTADNIDKGYGKFKDAQSLYQAYNSLQAEFTKRCQRIKELEVSLRKNKEAETLKGVAVVDNDVGNEVVDANKQSVSVNGEEAFLDSNKESLLDVTDGEVLNENKKENNDKNTSQNNLVENENKMVISDEQKNEIIKEYLEKLKKNGFNAIISGGEVIKTPVNRPKTVAEAGEMAKKYFSKIKEIF